MIDSGSRDRSVAIARAAGVRVVEIEPGEFGHGRTRNLGASLCAGELICFLTQDATPVPGLAGRLPRGVHARCRASAPPTARTCPAPTRAR